MAFLRLASASLLVTFLLAAAGGCDGDGQHLRQLRSERPDDRAAAAALLGMHGDSRAIPALRVALRDSALKVRAKAAWALGMLRSKGASAWALMQIEEPEVISALEMALQMEQDPWVQADLRRAAEHLRQFQGDVDLGESRFR